jgi:hypothetical protein
MLNDVSPLHFSKNGKNALAGAARLRQDIG